MPDQENLIPLVPVTRPDGRLYRPRKIAAYAVADEEGMLSGVMVLGTHDTERARVLADRYAAWQLGEGCAADSPETGWYRNGYEYGRLMWVRDEEKGRAGVFFRRIIERPPGTSSGQPGDQHDTPGRT